MIARRYKTPVGFPVQAVIVDEDARGETLDVEALDFDGEVVGYWPGLTPSEVDALAVRKGWSPCRGS